MINPPQLPHAFSAVPATSVMVEKTPSWLAMDDDLALGCECAYPSLQIERWGQEAMASSQASP